MNGIHEVTGSIPVWSTNPFFDPETGLQVVEKPAAVTPVPTKPLPVEREFRPERTPAAGAAAERATTAPRGSTRSVERVLRTPGCLPRPFPRAPRVAVHLRERELLAQLVAVAVVGVDVDRPLEQERLIQTVQLLANRFLPPLDLGDPLCRIGLQSPARRACTRSLTRRMKPAVGCRRASSSTNSSSSLALLMFTARQRPRQW